MAWKRSSVRSRSGPPNHFNNLEGNSGNNKPVPWEHLGIEKTSPRAMLLPLLIADLMFGLELQDLLATVNAPIASICAHPGCQLSCKFATEATITGVEGQSASRVAQSPVSE